METRTIETTGFEPEHTSTHTEIHWGAVIAGFAVGVGVHLLLTLIGVAGGFAAVGSWVRPDGESVSIAAAAWNTVSMLISAFVGGYVAARTSGLRRSTDGVLHGVVSWGATVLFFALVTGSVTGNAVSGMFGTAASVTSSVAASGNDAAMAELLASIQRGDRTAAIGVLRNRLGLSEDQAAATVDQALTMRGRGAAGVDPNRVENVAEKASIASTWLSAAMLLSLLAGAGGGLLGAHGARRRALPGRYGEHRIQTRVVRHHEVPTAG